MSKSGILVNTKEFFQSMVSKAMETRGVETFPLVEVYLSDLLEFYVSADNLFQVDQNEGRRKIETLAELYLKAQSANAPVRNDLLKKLGDTSLYISGFFGESLRRKIVDIDYYVEMGGAAYASLASNTNEDTYAKVFGEFSNRFVDYVDVLTYISQEALVQTNDDILRLYDHFLSTGSELAREQLIEKGILAPVKKAKDGH